MDLQRSTNPISGIRAVSVLIYVTGGQQTGALTIIGPEDALDLPPDDSVIRLVMQLAYDVSSRRSPRHPRMQNAAGEATYTVSSQRTWGLKAPARFGLRLP